MNLPRLVLALTSYGTSGCQSSCPVVYRMVARLLGQSVCSSVVVRSVADMLPDNKVSIGPNVPPDRTEWRPFDAELFLVAAVVKNSSSSTSQSLRIRLLLTGQTMRKSKR